MPSGQDAWTRAVLDAVPQPLLVIDTDGAVAYANDAARATLEQRDLRRLLGRSTHEILHAHHVDGSPYPADECPIVRSGTSPRPASGREVFLGRSGRAVSVSWQVSTLPRATHRLLAFTPEKAHSPRVFPPPRTLGGGPLTAESIRAQVTAGFRDPDLTPNRLARDNHVSLRTLQSVLAQQGHAPATMIRLARLTHARGLLRQGESPRAAAFASGFADADTFTRAFRREFGVVPSGDAP